jgi:hypothetical protein
MKLTQKRGIKFGKRLHYIDDSGASSQMPKLLHNLEVLRLEEYAQWYHQE